MRSLDLIGCGALNVDLIYRLPRSFPLWEELGPPGTEQLMEPDVRRAVDEALANVRPARSGGGQAANTAHALARLGYRAAMIGRVGADDDGLFIINELAPAEAGLVARDGETGRVYVLLDEDGERRNLVWPGANDGFSPGDLPRRPPKARFVYFSSFVGDGPLEAQLSSARAAARRRRRSAFDPGEIYARKGVKRFLPILQRCAYLFATEKELAMLCGLSLPESLDFVLNAGVGLVVCKMGGRGARLVGRRVDLYVPPLPAEVVDVTGAGDLFAAGFIAALDRAGRPRERRPARGLGRQPRHRRSRAQRLPRRGRLAGAPGGGALGGRGRDALERPVRIGWLSSGRDQAARNLLADVVARAQQDDVPLEIAAVFCDRERGEAAESDQFLDLVERLDFPLVTLSSNASWAAAQERGRRPRHLARRLPPGGDGPARAPPPRRARDGRVHARRQPGHVPPLRAAQPAPGAPRRPHRHLAGGHLAAARGGGRGDRRHDAPGHGSARPRPGDRLLPLPDPRGATGTRSGTQFRDEARDA